MEFIVEKERIYHLDEQQQVDAEINWRQQDGVMYANHTYTAPSLRGQGVAGQLFAKLVEYATEHNLLIYPICTYVIKQFDSSDKYTHLDARRTHPFPEELAGDNACKI